MALNGLVHFPSTTATLLKQSSLCLYYIIRHLNVCGLDWLIYFPCQNWTTWNTPEKNLLANSRPGMGTVPNRAVRVVKIQVGQRVVIINLLQLG